MNINIFMYKKTPSTYRITFSTLVTVRNFRDADLNPTTKLRLPYCSLTPAGVATSNNSTNGATGLDLTKQLNITKN